MEKSVVSAGSVFCRDVRLDIQDGRAVEHVQASDLDDRPLHVQNLKDGQAVRLLRDINWHGPAQVEFKMDARTGRPVLMEVNGRFWGALALSVEAGVDFPHLACLLATGQALPGVPDYPVGLRYAWLVPFGLAHVLNGPGRLRAAADFTWVALTGGCDVQLTDPLPSLAALARSARGWRELGGKGSS